MHLLLVSVDDIELMVGEDDTDFVNNNDFCVRCFEVVIGQCFAGHTTQHVVFYCVRDPKIHSCP